MSNYYVFYSHVATMALVGFGYLMTFVRRYRFGAVGYTFLVTVLVRCVFKVGFLSDHLQFDVISRANGLKNRIKFICDEILAFSCAVVVGEERRETPPPVFLHKTAATFRFSAKGFRTSSVFCTRSFDFSCLVQNLFALWFGSFFPNFVLRDQRQTNGRRFSRMLMVPPFLATISPESPSSVCCNWWLISIMFINSDLSMVHFDPWILGARSNRQMG